MAASASSATPRKARVAAPHGQKFRKAQTGFKTCRICMKATVKRKRHTRSPNIQIARDSGIMAGQDAQSGSSRFLPGHRRRPWRRPQTAGPDGGWRRRGAVAVPGNGKRPDRFRSGRLRDVLPSAPLSPKVRASSLRHRRQFPRTTALIACVSVIVLLGIAGAFVTLIAPGSGRLRYMCVDSATSIASPWAAF